jgi:hypothetical protein
MVEHIFVKMRQAHRTAVRDEMYLMPAAGETQAEFRGHYARTAVGRIANNADFHSAGFCPV